MAWTQAEIDRQYAESERIANDALSQGNTALAHQHHKHMQNLVAESQRLNASSGGGGGGSSGGVDPALAWQQEQARQAKIAEQNRVIGTLKAAFSEYGLDGLYGQITKWARQDYSADAILLELRKTKEYKDRFPAMEALSKKGRGITEAEYIAFEREATRLEREYGLPAGMLGKDSVTDLLTNEVSAKELGERVVLASNASQQVPDEMRTQFAKFYGVQEGDLAAYFLDSDRAMPLLERQYAASNIAGQGLIQGVDTTKDIAEDLFEAGVTTEGAREGFGRVARDKTLTQGKSNSISQESLTRGTFGESDYAKQINRARNAEVGQYAGGGSFVSSESGMSGLGKAKK